MYLKKNIRMTIGFDNSFDKSEDKSIDWISHSHTFFEFHYFI